MALVRSGIRVNIRQSPWIRWESSLKSTVVSNVDSIPKSTTSNKSTSLFPWRERPDVIEASWFKKKAFDVFFSTFRHPESGKASCLLSDKQIIDGAQSAFAACLNGIFQHNLVDNVCLKHPDNSKENSPEDAVKMCKSEVPLLSDILQQKLAQFYDNAVLKCSINRQDLGYMLIAADIPTIVDREIVVGSNRLRNITSDSFGRSTRHFPITYVFDGPPAENLQGAKEQALKALNGYVCIRYWLDIECEEVFFVRDKVTGEIIQGSTEPQHVVHQILLENGFEFDWNESRITKHDEDWSIVDLDDWMKGNKFWAKSKFTDEEENS